MYSSQHLKWIKTFHQRCPKTKTIPVLVLRQLILFFDPLQNVDNYLYIYVDKFIKLINVNNPTLIKKKKEKNVNK